MLIWEQGDVRSHVSWENSRPPYWEENAISLLMELLDKDTTAASPGFRLHIAHLSSTTALPIIAKAKQQGRLEILSVKGSRGEQQFSG